MWRFLAVGLALFAGPSSAWAADRDVDQVVGSYLSTVARWDPAWATAVGISLQDHAGLPDHSPASISAFGSQIDTKLATLRAIDPATLSPARRAARAILQEQLEASIQMRDCRTELWNVNHSTGWPAAFAGLAAVQPVGEPALRAQALARWAGLPRFVDTEIANLQRGLALEYSAPKSVVVRTIAQVESMVAGPPETSPFYSVAARDSDPEFKAAFAESIARDINPALRRYAAYLRSDYLPKAREGIAVSDLPDGPACYRAFLRANTTLKLDPRELFDQGSRTVSQNMSSVVVMGEQRFGETDFSQIVARAKARPENQFSSRDELLSYSRSLLERARSGAEAVVVPLPRQELIIEAARPFEEAAGVSSHYEITPDIQRPAVFRIQLGHWVTETRGDAAVAVVHEAWPGHHLQIALSRELQPDAPLSGVVFNAAFVEGWARYSEDLGEELGLYEDDALILRRVWPARGMVVDPGLHSLGWGRQQAVEYIVASGRFTPAQAEAMVDRIAAQPGQLTAYDTGAGVIRELRHEAQTALGDRFDLQAFHITVLEEGAVPLWALQAHVRAWIARQPRSR